MRAMMRMTHSLLVRSLGTFMQRSMAGSCKKTDV